ncbi:DNA cytosine methyltransferase [Sporomusa sp. KB1]|uniref:DNA cytosine methyltransferase n=1 Tax=Sporomusa sp. KB1 TaxID=943346 RepID=UPI0011ABA1D3|nr:DNA cytosine methyltransferase [Sporomusa sp. KB1]TWH48540.1 DNA (cytosine-5)-methyltransferase 1 [Sporomusa sp. KB1]
MKNSRFKVVSTFAGCGGSSLGYKLAGGKVLMAVEWDDNAAETYRINHPGTYVYHGDIANLSVQEILNIIGLMSGELDIFDGSPPCQGFSMSGKREMHDGRNQLFREYVRLLRGLQPKVFVMENVAGMVKGKMKIIFAAIMRELKASGYNVSARLMNAMYFGVPQSRPRMIFIGVRKDLGILPSHPKAQCRPITFRQACYDLRGNNPDDRMLGEMLLKVARLQPDSWSTDPVIYKAIKGNFASSISTQWIGWDRVCGTLTKSEISTSGLVHPDRERYISLAEAKRISSFPDEFKFTDRKSGIVRMGNCVPPLLMKAIAEHIRDNILIVA